MKNLLETSLTPENDMQDLWELSGRVKAVLAWIESNPYIDKDILAAMLGGQVQKAGSFVQMQETQMKEGAGAMYIEVAPVPEQESVSAILQERGGSNGENC